MRTEAVAEVRVLVVDDDPLSLAATEAVLAPIATVVCATSGPEALEALDWDEFAAVLLDVGMPGIDGFETARLIKERPDTRHMPIIFLSGRIGEEEIRRGYAVGAVDYLLKPFEPEILQAKVSVFVDLARLRLQSEGLSHRSLHDQLTGLRTAPSSSTGSSSRSPASRATRPASPCSQRPPACRDEAPSARFRRMLRRRSSRPGGAKPGVAFRSNGAPT